MYNSISRSQIFVLGQTEAVNFYADEPSEKPYGIDFGIRDPFGNAIRIGQMFDGTPR
jgi:hypothetical protein